MSRIKGRTHVSTRPRATPLLKISLAPQGASTHVVNGKTRARVRLAVQRLGYVYQRGAASLRTGAVITVGLIINELTDPFYGEIAVGADRELTAAGILPFLGTTGESPARQATMMKVMREHGAAGFIVCPALGADRALLAESEDWHLPVVSVMRPVPGARASFVGTRNRCGAERATVHLLGLGH